MTDSADPSFRSQLQAGNSAWMIVSTALVLLTIPGLWLVHAGLTHKGSAVLIRGGSAVLTGGGSALSMLWITMMSVGVSSFQWFLWGYSLTFSRTGGKFIGNLQNIAFIGALAAPSIAGFAVPGPLLPIFQGAFACITVALTIGATSEGVRVERYLVFVLVWSTFIYDPVARWIWNPAGWASIMGALDFAGGTPVHIVSGSTALAYAFMLDKRRDYENRGVNDQPADATLVILGTVCQWVGSFGFSVGSALSANLRVGMAGVVTNIAAGVGGLAWGLLEYRLERKWSSVGICSGVISGLVVISPGSGYVPVWSAFIFGVVGAVSCSYATKLKEVMRIDDPTDVFAVHTIGGFVGNILTGVFASSYIDRLDDATHIYGGLVNRNLIQIVYQLALSVAGFVYAFGGTCAILFVMNSFPELSLRVGAEGSSGETRAEGSSGEASAEGCSGETTGLLSNNTERPNDSYGTNGKRTGFVASRVELFEERSNPGQSNPLDDSGEAPRDGRQPDKDFRNVQYKGNRAD